MCATPPLAFEARRGVPTFLYHLGRFRTLSKLGKIELISAAAEVARHQRTYNILYNWFGTATAPVGLKTQNHCLRMQTRVKK